MSSLPERLRAARASLKLTQKEIAAQSGVSERSYQGYEDGRSVPGGDAIAGLVRLGISADWLLLGHGEMLLAPMATLLSDPMRQAVDAFFPDSIDLARKPYDLGGTHDAPQSVEQPHAPYGFVLVPRYDVSASMGNGAVIHSEQIVDHLAFREAWVRTELNTSPKNLVLISAIGDSMEPTLRAGDLLLIDRGGEGVKQDAIYAFAMNGELRVKRMQLKLDGSVMVRSDNPQYEAERLSADQIGTLNIVGRVVWSGRRM